MLDPHRVRIFRSVVASGSIQAAADNLRLTASAVSQHMGAFQKETGLTLFERAGRGIQPTEAARVLDTQADVALIQWARLDSVVADLREGRAGRLVIGYFASAGATWMPQLVKRLASEDPDLVLELVLTEDDTTATPDIDIVIDPPSVLGRPGYRRIPLVTDPYVVVVPADHPLAGRSSIALTELRDDVWVSNDHARSHGHRAVVGACAAAGFRPRFAVQAQDHVSAVEFVAAGVGITVLPGLAAAILPPNVVPVALDAPAPQRHLAVMLRDIGAVNPVAEHAVDLLTEIIGRSSRRGRTSPQVPAMSPRAPVPAAERAGLEG